MLQEIEPYQKVRQKEEEKSWLLPEELSYCKSGGGPLRHKPIKNWLFLSWTRVSIFFFFFWIEVEWYEGKSDVLQRERGLRKPKVSLSLSHRHTHSETNHRKGVRVDSDHKTEMVKKKAWKKQNYPSNNRPHHHSTDTHCTRWTICHLLNTLLTAYNLYFTPGSTLPAPSVESYLCIFNCWHISYTPGVCACVYLTKQILCSKKRMDYFKRFNNTSSNQ